MIDISLDEFTNEVIAYFSSKTGLTEIELIDRILSAHLMELWELRNYLETVPKDSEEVAIALNLLVSFGPESLLSGIRRIAPSYKTFEEEFIQRVHTSSNTTSGGNNDN